MSDKRRNRPRRMQRVLTDERSELATLRRRTGLLEQATRDIGAALPDRFHGHWRVAALSHEALVIAAASPVWATALRSHQPTLLTAAGALLGQSPQRLQVRVSNTPGRAWRAAGHHLSPNAAAILEEAAGISDNPRLAAALRRLASRSSPH